jgi:hypothetical protein
MKRLLDSQNSIARRKKIRENGFTIADIPLKRKKNRVKGFLIARILL